MFLNVNERVNPFSNLFFQNEKTEDNVNNAVNNVLELSHIDEFIQWHDRACQVNKALPMA